MINKSQYQKIHGQKSSQNEMDRRWLLFEAEQAAFIQSGGSIGGAAVSTPTFQTITNTVWIYPVSDTQWALANTSAPFYQDGNALYFPTIEDMGQAYDDIYLRTESTQPIGNEGYSLGVGTILLDQYQELEFRLAGTNELIVTWRLTKQLTDQNDLPVGGDSPVGTVGYLTVYENWPIADRPAYYDPVFITPGTPVWV